MDPLLAAKTGDNSVGEGQDSLVVIWSSGDREVALKMAFMYAFNAKSKGWWKDVRLIVWGPSTKLLSEDGELQEYMRRMKDAGVILEACKTCSDQYGVSEQLEELAIAVYYIGETLTTYLKEGRRVISF